MSNDPTTSDSVVLPPSSNVVSSDTPMEAQCPPAPDVLTMSDLLSDQSVVVAKEQADRALLETIGTQIVANLRPKLVEWLLKGRPDGYPILSLDIQPPSVCSDGLPRTLPDYIEFCSGKTIVEHVALLQEKLPDIYVSFANIGGITTIVVLKA
jgi:hypothetical protein